MKGRLGIALLLFPALVMCSFSSSAQKDDVGKAIELFHALEYNKSFELLTELLAGSDKMSDLARLKAHFYLAKSETKLLHQAKRDKNKTALEEYKDAYINAYDNLRKAEVLDNEGLWEGKIKTELGVLQTSLIRQAKTLLNTTLNSKIGNREKQSAYQRCARYADAYISLEKKNYVAYDIRGQAYQGLERYDDAIQDYESALTVFASHPPKQADLLACYIAYRQSKIYRDQKFNMPAALQTAESGIIILNAEWQRLQEVKARYSEPRWNEQMEKYSFGRKDFQALLLDIYLQYPEKREEALIAFQEAVDENPKHYMYHIGYAQLLEGSDINLAKEVYQKAIKIDPDRFLAHFNMAAVLNNQAAESYKLANSEADPERSGKYKESVDYLLREAMSHFENAQQINPLDRTTKDALEQIYLYLGLMDKYEMIKSK